MPKKKYVHHHMKCKCQRGGNLMEGLNKAAQVIKDNQLISRGIQVANALGYNSPLVAGAATVASQAGYGQTGGANYRLAVMPSRPPPFQQVGSGWQDVVGGLVTMPGNILAGGIMGANAGLGASFKGLLGGRKKKRKGRKK